AQDVRSPEEDPWPESSPATHRLDADTDTEDPDGVTYSAETAEWGQTPHFNLRHRYRHGNDENASAGPACGPNAPQLSQDPAGEADTGAWAASAAGGGRRVTGGGEEREEAEAGEEQADRDVNDADAPEQNRNPPPRDMHGDRHGASAAENVSNDANRVANR